jgi:hypothetical protein
VRDYCIYAAGAPPEAPVDPGIPVVTLFLTTTVTNTLAVPTQLQGSDDVAIAGYLITTSSTAPSFTNPLWTATSPTNYTVTNYGSHTLYAWVKDGAGNVSPSASATGTAIYQNTNGTHVFYVAPTGNDTTGDGGINNPWLTLEYATAQMDAGDTLYVRGGTYSEVFDLVGPDGTAEAPTTVIAWPGETPVFDHNDTAGGGHSLNHLNYFTLSGLTLRELQAGLYVYAGCSNVVVSNMTVHTVGQAGIYVRQDSYNITVADCFVHNTGLSGNFGEGIYVGTGDNPGDMDNTHHVTVIGCTVSNALCEGIEIKAGTHDIIVDGNLLIECNQDPQAGGGAGGGAIEVNENGTYNYYAGSQNHIIRNNTIRDTEIGIRAGCHGLYYNNIIWNAADYGIRINQPFNPTTSNELRRVYHNTVAMSTNTAITVANSAVYEILNNIGATNSTYNLPTNSAYFFNAGNRDYHLVAGAAPINAGTNLTSVVATDADGNARSTPDLGAFEYSGPQTNLRVWNVNNLIVP